MSIEHEVTPTIAELKARVAALEAKLAAYEQGPDDAEVVWILARADVCSKSNDDHSDLVKRLARALRAERAKVAELEKQSAIDNACGDSAFKTVQDRAESAEARVKELEAEATEEVEIRHAMRKEQERLHGELRKNGAEVIAFQAQVVKNAESRLKEQGEALAAAEKALEVYARREPECANEKKGWNWYVHVCDNFSGQASHFDWKGEEQNEPWEVAESALAKLRAAKGSK